MLKVGEVKEIYEMKRAGRSIPVITGELSIVRNTVRRYLKSPEAIMAKARPRQASKLDPYTGYIDRRLDDGLEKYTMLHRELKARGYDGGYSILKAYVSPRRRPQQPDATKRFETTPSEHALMNHFSSAFYKVLKTDKRARQRPMPQVSEGIQGQRETNDTALQDFEQAKGWTFRLNRVDLQ